MIAFDPDLIDIDQTADIVEKDGEPHIHQTWQMTIPEQGGTAYIRITPQLRDFFKMCHEKNGVVGFEYDFDEAGLNFGLILKKDDTDEKARNSV